MSTAPAPARRPSARRYVLAGVLAAVALVIATVVAVVIGRALGGYDIAPLPAGAPATVTVGERGEAIWVSPQEATGTCTSTDVETGASSIWNGTASSMTTTDHGRTWSRVGIVRGEPGSRHTVTCTGSSAADVFGHAANPRVARYVTIGVVGGGTAGVLGLAGFVLALVTAIQRSRRPA
ncbi:hypothetical protein [Aeromicrobium chenweiae]|uniref:Uncharacterized protein n=1 Tax=Aeromicrobium chenweiae TaxID=2079793 RepID=A0A2S0WPI2_9ACTN|nr:hypothetical protein [Aeromicrobium chenweiae]AWB93226.1 hypothetical protein C3E78_14000 [Aeromicrobium chenweiae]TGN34218.1 hypothetical protein E4L97_04035 [Aeromicrobium chenweiae]